MKISYKKSYEKMYRKLPLAIKEKTDERIMLFSNDPSHEILNNHALTWEYEGYRSINITGDYRALFRELSGGYYEFVEFVEVGTHSQLYW